MKRGFWRLTILLFASGGLLFGISSCGFVGALFGGGGNGSGTSDYYALTIDYSYWGRSAVSVGSPIVFWIMPLDENGNIIQDTDNPDGGPVREVREAYIPTGSLSMTLATGSYIVLAFHDSLNKNDMPDLREPYVLYNDRYFADSTVTPYRDSNGVTQYFVDPHWDTVDLNDHDERIYLGFGNQGQKFEWHAVYIASPDDGDYIDAQFFTVAGGLFGDWNTTLEVEVDGAPIPGSVTMNDTGDTWYARINTFDFPDQTHGLRVKALDQSGEVFDSYTIGFVERDGKSEPSVYIASPYENQYILDFLDISGKYNPGSVSYVEVLIDGISYGYAALNSSDGTWDFGIQTSSLSSVGSHIITVDALDDFFTVSSYYSVDFMEANGAYAYIDPLFYNSSQSSDFPVWGYFDEDAVKYIQIQIDSDVLQDVDTMDFGSRKWDYYVSTASLATGSHTLTVYAFDRYYNLLSTYQIPFDMI